jgi:hypothetical protein
MIESTNDLTKDRLQIRSLTETFTEFTPCLIDLPEWFRSFCDREPTKTSLARWIRRIATALWANLTWPVLLYLGVVRLAVTAPRRAPRARTITWRTAEGAERPLRAPNPPELRFGEDPGLSADVLVPCVHDVLDTGRRRDPNKRV